MGLFSAFGEIASSGISIGEATEIVNEGFSDAISTMEGMIGNAGQQSVFDSYVLDAFASNKSPIKEGWTDVDIGEYMDFMGEIVDEGNSIMGDAYSEAQDILSELEEEAEAFGDEGDFEEF
jgi:hypothetical protein